MTKELIILALIVLVLYYYQKKETKPALNESWIWETKEKNLPSKDYQKELDQTKQANQTLTAFLRNSLERSPDNLDKLLEELKTKLNNKTLNEILEQNEDWETEVDTLTRAKNSLEADLLAQSNAFQSRIKEKEREIKRIKEDLASEKQQHKGSIERITKLTQQITSLTKEKNQATEKLEQITNLVNHWEINSLTKKQLTELKKFLKNE